MKVYLQVIAANAIGVHCENVTVAALPRKAAIARPLARIFIGSISVAYAYGGPNREKPKAKMKSINTATALRAHAGEKVSL
jgi:hypothetical protein